jgi:phage tail protein X
MNRYSNQQIDKRFDGKRYYKTTYYPAIPIGESDTYIITNESMYLDALAYKYYGDVSLWWILYIANSLKDGRVSVPAGIQLRIPSNYRAIIDEFNRINA